MDDIHRITNNRVMQGQYWIEGQQQSFYELNLAGLRLRSVEGLDRLLNIFNVPNSRLVELSLSNNQFIVLPNNFMTKFSIESGNYFYPRMRILSLSNNRLERLPDHFLSDLPIGELYLSDNQLVELPDNFLANTPQLRELYLNNNRLVSLPNDFLANSPYLERLELDDNQLPESVIDALVRRVPVAAAAMGPGEEPSVDLFEQRSEELEEPSSSNEQSEDESDEEQLD